MVKITNTALLYIVLLVFLTGCAVGPTKIKRGGFETQLSDNTRLNVKPSGKVFLTFRVTD